MFWESNSSKRVKRALMSIKQRKESPFGNVRYFASTMKVICELKEGKIPSLPSVFIWRAMLHLRVCSMSVNTPISVIFSCICAMAHGCCSNYPHLRYVSTVYVSTRPKSYRSVWESFDWWRTVHFTPRVIFNVSASPRVTTCSIQWKTYQTLENVTVDRHPSQKSDSEMSMDFGKSKTWIEMNSLEKNSISDSSKGPKISSNQLFRQLITMPLPRTPDTFLTVGRYKKGGTFFS